jgi:hypothetical protein
MPEKKQKSELDIPKGKYTIDFEKKTIKSNAAQSEPVSFNSLPEALALILPAGLNSGFFNQIEAEYRKLTFGHNSGLIPFVTYCKMYNLTRKSVYLRRDRGEVEIIKQGRYSYVKDLKK